MKHSKTLLLTINLLLLAMLSCPKSWANTRVARITQGCFRYSNWGAPYLTFDGYTDTTATRIVVPDSVDWNGRKYPVVEIGPGAVRKCHFLSYLEVGERIESVTKDAMLNCPNLRVIKFNCKVPPRFNLDHPFHGVDSWTQIIDYYHTLSTVLVVPEGTEEAYRNALGWGEFKVILTHMPSEDEMLIDEIDARINELESELLRAKQVVNRIQEELDAMRKAKDN